MTEHLQKADEPTVTEVTELLDDLGRLSRLYPGEAKGLLAPGTLFRVSYAVALAKTANEPERQRVVLGGVQADMAALRSGHAELRARLGLVEPQASTP